MWAVPAPAWIHTLHSTPTHVGIHRTVAGKGLILSHQNEKCDLTRHNLCGIPSNRVWEGVGVVKVLKVLSWHTLEIWGKQMQPGQNCGSLEVLSSCWHHTLLALHQHPPIAAHSDTALLEGGVKLTLRWQCPILHERSSCITHHLQCFLGAACPPIITMLGLGLALSALCPCMAKLGQGGDVMLKWSCMWWRWAGAQHPAPDTAPLQLPAHTAWLLPPLLPFLLFVRALWRGGTWVQQGLQLHCLGSNAVSVWEGPAAGTWWRGELGPAQLNPALPLPGWPRCLHGSMPWGLGTAPTAQREEPITGISKEQRGPQWQRSASQTFIFDSVQNVAVIAIRHQTHCWTAHHGLWCFTPLWVRVLQD